MIVSHTHLAKLSVWLPGLLESRLRLRVDDMDRLREASVLSDGVRDL